ncbi:hypothetical protein MKX03_025222 [Papaver bracteatum]|nr:hypothetical protein MKX03_025222 [Papaver bracteatum]
MRDIVNNPTKFSEDEKINTLLSFHKDTCANIISQLYPSNGDDDALEDLKILKSFEPVLAGLELECRLTYSKASYENFRAKKQLLQKKIAMSVVLKSPDAAVLQEDIKNWMMQKLVEYNDEKDDGYYKNDEERLEGLEEGKNNALSYLRKLGVDMSEYRDSDASDQYLNGQPIQVTIDEYKLLEKVITRTCDKMDQLSEDAYPIAQYLGDIKRHVEIFEEHLTKGAFLIRHFFFNFAILF